MSWTDRREYFFQSMGPIEVIYLDCVNNESVEDLQLSLPVFGGTDE